MKSRSLSRSGLACVAVLALHFFHAAAHAATRVPGPLVSTDWVAAQLENPEVVIIDVRDDTANFDRQPTDKEKADPKAPLVGHIPGARLMPWKSVRETREIDGVKLDKMLPAPQNFESAMRKLGVRADQAIVIATNGKDSDAVTMGTRLYWTLKYFGHDNMALLDGGVRKWKAESRPIAFEARVVTPSNYALNSKFKPEILAQLADVESAVGRSGTQIVDGRTADYYVGQSMTSDVVRKGHIPGARMFAHKDLVDEKTGMFLPRAELQALASDAGIKGDVNTIAHCNTGHLASGAWFVLSELLGNANTRLYDGSMHEWTKSSTRPVTRKWEMP